MTDFFVGTETRQQIRQILQFKGDIKKHTIDFSVWADDLAAVTGVTWTVESGDASIGTEALSSNLSSIILTTDNPGNSMIKALATDGTHSEAVYIRVLTKDPRIALSRNDYGFFQWC